MSAVFGLSLELTLRLKAGDKVSVAVLASSERCMRAHVVRSHGIPSPFAMKYIGRVNLAKHDCMAKHVNGESIKQWTCIMSKTGRDRAGAANKRRIRSPLNVVDETSKVIVITSHSDMAW